MLTALIIFLSVILIVYSLGVFLLRKIFGGYSIWFFWPCMLASMIIHDYKCIKVRKNLKKSVDTKADS